MGFQQRIANIKEKQKTKLPLSLEPGSTLHAENARRAQETGRVNVLHAALEYGMPSDPQSIGVGGVGSVLRSLTLAQQKTKDVDSRVIMPFYPSLHGGSSRFKVVKEVKHCFKGEQVTSKILETKTFEGVTIYLVESDPRYQTLFRAISNRSYIYSDVENSRFIDRCGYMSGAMTACAIEGIGLDATQSFVPHIIQGHSWSMSLIAALMQQYRTLYAMETPRTLYTVHSDHHGDSVYKQADLPDIGIPIVDETALLSQMTVNHYDHLVYVSEQLLKESICTPSAFSHAVLERYKTGDTSAILNNVFAEQFDPSVCLPTPWKFDLNKIFDGKLKLKQHLSQTFLKDQGKRIHEDKPLTLYLGRYSAEKGIDQLERAIEAVLKNGGTFMSMGVGYHPIIEALQEKYKNHPNVIFLTTADEQQRYGQFIRPAADIYFVPSKMEACGLVPMEGNMTGAMVLCSEVGGLVNVVKPDANGMRFSQSSEIEPALTTLHHTWQELYASSHHENLNAVFNAIQESARKTFAWDAEKVGAVKAYHDLYKTMLAGRNALEVQARARETALTQAILEDDENAIIALLAEGRDLTQANLIGLTPQELATRLGREDIVEQIRQRLIQKHVTHPQNKYTKSEPAPKRIILQVCLEYNKTNFGGVGETVTALTREMHKQEDIDVRVMMPHFPWHDTLVARAALQLVARAALQSDGVVCEVNHQYKNKLIKSQITRLHNDGVIEYLVKPSPGQLSPSEERELFSEVEEGQQRKIFDNIVPKVAYFNSAVAAFVMSEHPASPRVDVLNAHSWGCGLAARLIKDNYKSEQPKCVLTVHSEFSEQGVVLAGNPGISAIEQTGLRCHPNQEGHISLLKEGILGSDHVVYVSEALGRQAVNHGGVFSISNVCRHYEQQRQATTIMNGISDVFDPQKLQVSLPELDLNDLIAGKRAAKLKINQMIQDMGAESADEVACLKHKQFDPDKPLTLFVGRFLEEKGIDALEIAIEETLKRSGNFVVMGLYGGQKEDETIQALARKYQDNPGVVILHEKSYVVQRKYGPLIRLASNFTFIPSHRESCGLVSMEAQLNRNLVISSDAGGLKDTVKEGQTGFMYERTTDPSNTNQSIAAAMGRAFEAWDALKTDPEKHQAKLRELHDYSLRHYLWSGEEGGLKKYLSLFRQLAQRPGPKLDLVSTSTRRIPHKFAEQLADDIDMRRGLPDHFVELSKTQPQTIFELPGYPHYVMKTQRGDILAIVADRSTGAKEMATLGQGALGKVLLGKLLYSPTAPHLVGGFLAVKQQKIREERHLESLRNEIRTLDLTQGLFLPYLESDQRDPQLKFMFQHLYSGKTLAATNQDAQLSFFEKMVVSQGCLTQLHVLHEAGVLHLDIHDRNILVDGLRAQLIDFGTSRTLGPNQTSMQLRDGWMQAAPREVQALNLVSAQTEVYTMGMTLAGFFSKELNIGRANISGDIYPGAWTGLPRIRCLGDIISDQRAVWVANSPLRDDYRGAEHVFLEEMRELIVEMLSPNMDDRPSIETCLRRIDALLDQIESSEQDPKFLATVDLSTFCTKFGFEIQDLSKPNRYGTHALNYACEQGYTEIVRQLLSTTQIRFVASAVSGNHPLHYAVKQGHWKIADLLLAHGLDPNVKNKVGLSAGAMAKALPDGQAKAKIEDLFLLYRFIRAHDFDRSHLNQRNSQGDTPLTRLMREPVTEAHLKLLGLLVQHGAHVECTDRSKRSPLYYAVINADAGFLKPLLSYGADSAVLLTRLKKEGLDIGVVKINQLKTDAFCKKHKIPALDPTALTEFGHTALTLCASLGDLEQMILFIWQYHDQLPGVSIQEILNSQNRYGNTPLHIAAETKNLAMVDFVLENNVDVCCRNQFGQTVFDLLRSTAPEIQRSLSRHIQKLLGYVQDKNKFLIQAYQNGDFTRIFMLSHFDPAVLSQSDAFLRFVLGQSLSKEQLSRLVEMGFDVVDFLNRHPGMTVDPKLGPLFNVLRFLKDNRFSSLGNLDASNDSLHTPLTKAVILENQAIINSLVQVGADINQANAVGNTPLHLAVDENNMELVKVCLRLGADPKCINNTGESPMDIARRLDLKPIIDLFERSRNGVLAENQKSERSSKRSVVKPEVKPSQPLLFKKPSGKSKNKPDEVQRPKP